MIEQPIAPLIPNMGNQGEAVAASSAVIFTATDRKIIKERGGEIEKDKSFREVFSKKPLTPKVENEETTIKPEQDIDEIEGRIHEHRRMLKNSPVYVPKDQIEISNRLPDTYEQEEKNEAQATANDTFSQSETNINNKPDKNKESPTTHSKTITMAEELKLNPSELFDKFSLEQKELFSLISRIKNLHIKRLLTESREEFEKYSKKIEKETLARSNNEAKAWIKAKLNKLTLSAALYKLKFLQSLQSIDNNSHPNKNSKWLKEIVIRLSKV